MNIRHLEIPANSLNNRCDPAGLGFQTTDDIAPLDGLIGQDRAVRALELALDLDEPGFNLFISGLPGTGRGTALRSHVERIALGKRVPPDWGYIHNFQDPSQPLPISLPCGWMSELAADMDELVHTVRRDVPKVFESDDYSQRMEAAMQGLQSQRQEMTASMEHTVAEAGFSLGSTQSGITPIPVINGQPITPEGFSALPEEEREQIRLRSDEVQQTIARALSEIRRLGKSATEEAREVDKDIVRFTLTPIIDELQEKYARHLQIVSYLDRVQADMVEHLELLKPKDPAPGALGQPSADDESFLRYKVNDLVDNTTCESAPIVFENNPTYYNLFGRIDYQARMGTLTTNHTMIKSGAIHESNGGYLVLQARELLANPLSWQTLKRTLECQEICVENIGEQASPLPSSSLRPRPIPFDAKIIIVGTPEILAMLESADEDFRRHFKVTAEFDTRMDRTPDNTARYAAFVSLRCHEDGLQPFDNTAVARVIEYSSRVAEHQGKLTTRFNHMSDILTEANYWAQSAQQNIVSGEQVQKAIEQRRHRSSLREERLQELIQEGTVRISTDGAAVGQVNGLAVLSFGDVYFGKPSRITARVSLGNGQLVNVERETDLSGRIHDKGFLALTGYLRGKYGADKPLSLNASITFEQSYSEVDGDSASSTELYALLSAISGIPIAQGIAVTGSINQNGEVQAIGGATQKIEGFFDTCKVTGLTGSQGVLVPRDNLKHLALNDEVIWAVEAGRFRVYGVSTVDEGIEVLTGIPAGERQDDGNYPGGTIHSMVEERLREMAQEAREFSPGGNPDRNAATSAISTSLSPEQRPREMLRSN